MALENAGCVEEMAKSISCRRAANGVLLVRVQAYVVRVEVKVGICVENVEV
jgi:hypothetical protein